MRLNGEVFCVYRARAVPTYRELTSTSSRLVHEVVNDAVLKGLVGAPGFEPGTSCAQGKPPEYILLILPVFSASYVTI